MTIRTDAPDRDHPRTALDAAGVRDAYRRWAGVYDAVFGGVSAFGRRRAVEEVNRLPGTRVLEVGVGTGLALPRYRGDKRVVGVDLSREMLEKAAERVREERLGQVVGLAEMDAEKMAFADGAFDIAVAMFTASVVPDAKRLYGEMSRVVRPRRAPAVRQPLRRGGRAALVGGARHGAAVPPAGLAPGFRAARPAGSRPGAGGGHGALPPGGLFTWCGCGTSRGRRWPRRPDMGVIAEKA
jgi:SAM-dependent methyltransferase